MKYVELYYQKLVSASDYSNVCFGARVAFEDGNGESREDVQARLEDYVDLNVARMVQSKTDKHVAANLEQEIHYLTQRESEVRESLTAMQKWMQENCQFVRAFEAASGTEVQPMPF